MDLPGVDGRPSTSASSVPDTSRVGYQIWLSFFAVVKLISVVQILIKDEYFVKPVLI
jgi:hypothetical protein